MNKPQAMEFPSYEVLSQLARDDPAAYEAWRCEVIDNFIENAPAKIKPRLRGLQWRVECVRKLAKTPLGSAVRLNDLMWQSFLSLSDHWLDLADRAEESRLRYQAALTVEAAPRQDARIIEFPGQERGTPALSRATDD